MTAQTNCSPAPWHAHVLRLAAVLALLLAFILPVPAAHAATLDACPTDAGFALIQDAIAAAAPGDTIRLCAATFFENIVVTKDLTLLGTTQDDTIIDGGANGSVVTVLPGVTAAISHLTLTNGRVEPSDAVGWGSGGGVHNEGHLTLDDVDVSLSVAYMGGGIANEGGELTLRNSMVTDNQAEMGGGVVNLGNWEAMATMLVSNTYVVDNFVTEDLFERSHDDAGSGGGLYNDYGILRVELSDIDSNGAERFGGAIQNAEGADSPAQLWVDNTVIRGNHAYVGGGINNNALAELANDSIRGNQARGAKSDQADGLGGGICNTGVLHVANSTINGNYASGLPGGTPGAPGGIGGGIYTASWSGVEDPSPDAVVLTNVTLADNGADGQGGGIYVGRGSPQLRNSIIAHNRPGVNCAGGTLASLGYNLADDLSCSLNGPGDQPGVDPLLGEWQDNGGPTKTYALLPGSPAIDAVAEGACTLATDQRGVLRPQGIRCDSGAFELEQGKTRGLLLSYARSGKVGGISFADEDILYYEFATGRWFKFFDGSDVGLGHSDVIAFELLADGSLLLVFNRDTRVPGLAKVVKEQDIVQFTPQQLGPTTAGSFAWYLRGSDLGFPHKGQGLDAIAFAPDGRLVISTRNRMQLLGVAAEDEDLLVWNAGAWSLYLDGSQIGLGDGPHEDIKAASIDRADGSVYLATAGAFSAGGVQGNGEQVFVCTPDVQGTVPGSPAPCSLSLFWDGAVLGPRGLAIDGLALVPTPPAMGAMDTVQAGEAEVDTGGDDVYDLDEDDCRRGAEFPAVLTYCHPVNETSRKRSPV